ncbi:uncharacterized protein LACBIDRAFT_334986 [Laccaria bicolor S238N-H82]|uniref:Predicted protein n=1 Tax=Laccaria bicolor (strain S238N-H82 / ATCC MYA-4686) TaxID=486041 RepID=B0E0Z8_LACBS|nr:uncharacterized protein LACBIDRAFT_334986 [Laccaria bicolor S238N-H82]EDQ99528.1 predicted protein [Laccaria bicolor S238N-H82]|eukprot:XP_001889877.1 predicted protein [Laccaria bicolor S238N-H82]
MATELTQEDLAQRDELRENSNDGEFEVEQEPESCGDNVEDMPPYITNPNSYGVFRSYPSSRSSFTPDELFTLNGVSDSLNFTPDAHSSEVRPWWSSFGSSLSSVKDFFAPFRNASVFHILNWHYNGSNLKSLSQLNTLVEDLIMQPDFKQEDFISFSASREAECLYNYTSENPESPFLPKDGWIETSVSISVPADSVKHSSVDAVPKYEVPGLFYRPLVEIIKASFQEPSAEHFNLFPFEEYWPAQHVTYIPKLGNAFQDWYIKTFGKSATAEVITHCRQELVQAIWRILLGVKFMVAYCHGIVMECADGIMWCFFPCFFFYGADYPEKTILACIKYLGNFPCPCCLISKVDISKLGTKRDRKLRNSKEQVDDENQQSKIQLVQDWIYKGGYGIVSVAVERILGPKSLIPMHNAFSERLLAYGFQFYMMFVPDLLHEFELSVWKATFTHLMHILHAYGDDAIQELNRRFRAMPTFGRDTIHKFHNNASAMKKLAACDFKDLLQIPYLTICTCDVAWFCKTSATHRVDFTITGQLHNKIRSHALKVQIHEEAAQGHRKAAATAKKLQNRKGSTPPPQKKTKVRSFKKHYFNLDTYKLHSLGDYVKTIKHFGTTDNTSTQTGELKHRQPKRFYPRVHKGKHVKGISVHQRRERILHKISLRSGETGNRQEKLCKGNRKNLALTIPFEEAENLPFTDPQVHHHMSSDTRHKIDVVQWVGENEDDPAMMNFILRLKNHLLSQLLAREYSGDETEFTSKEQNSVAFINNCIYSHKVLRVNYTTYDMRHEQDSLNPRTHADIMVVSQEPTMHEDGMPEHPYWYARIIGIFHTQVLHTGPESRTSEPQHMEFLWVRWFGLDQEQPSGWRPKRLHRVGFVDGEDEAAFGFLDPEQVICVVHLMPAFHHGQGTSNLKPSIARPLTEKDEDWVFYYIGMFADRDKVMRFRGGGVGHKSTRESMDQFLQDWDALNLIDKEPSEMELDSDFDNEDDNKEGNVGGDEDQEEWMDEDDDEEDDYGYDFLIPQHLKYYSFMAEPLLTKCNILLATQ